MAVTTVARPAAPSLAKRLEAQGFTRTDLGYWKRVNAATVALVVMENGPSDVEPAFICPTEQTERFALAVYHGPVIEGWKPEWAELPGVPRWSRDLSLSKLARRLFDLV